MDFFLRAKVVRLRSIHNKYLAADEDEIHIRQLSDGSSPQTLWTVRCISDLRTEKRIQLASCFGRFLAATRHTSLLGLVGRKINQRMASWINSAVNWKPIRVGDGSPEKAVGRFKLRSCDCGYLWASYDSVTNNGNAVTLSLWPGWAIWDVEILAMTDDIPPSPPSALGESSSSSLNRSHSLLGSAAAVASGCSVRIGPSSQGNAPAIRDPSSQGNAPWTARTIFYTFAGDDGEIEESFAWRSFTFHGRSLLDLTLRLKRETNLDNVALLVRNPNNHILHPLAEPLLPPGRRPMRIIVADGNSNALGALLEKPMPFFGEIVSLPGLASQASNTSQSYPSTLDELKPGGQKISYTVTDDLSNINENSEWKSYIHWESLMDLPERLREEIQLDEILVFRWNPGSQLFVAFDPFVPFEDNITHLAVLNGK